METAQQKETMKMKMDKRRRRRRRRRRRKRRRRRVSKELVVYTQSTLQVISRPEGLTTTTTTMK